MEETRIEKAKSLITAKHADRIAQAKAIFDEMINKIKNIGVDVMYRFEDSDYGDVYSSLDDSSADSLLYLPQELLSKVDDEIAAEKKRDE